MNRVYPVGYEALGAREWLDELTKDPNVLIVDTRLKPWSWRVDYRETELKATYGRRYKQAGPFLGNRGYKDGYIDIVDPDTGIRGLIQYLSKGYDLVLLCQCASYLDCHRSTIVDLLQQKVNVEVVQPPVCHVETGVIKAISVRPPYGSWLSNPGWFINAAISPKTIENRSKDFTAGYRGTVLIHQSATFEHDAIPFWLSQCEEMKDAIPIEENQYPFIDANGKRTGAIIGEAELVKVITQEDREAKDPWFSGPYGLVLAYAKPIDPPIPCRGMLGLFDVNESILKGQK